MTFHIFASVTQKPCHVLKSSSPSARHQSVCRLVQDGVKPTEIEAFTVQQFHAADVDGDERVDYEEFVAYYQSISTTKARRELRSALGPQAESDCPFLTLPLTCPADFVAPDSAIEPPCSSAKQVPVSLTCCQPAFLPQIDVCPFARDHCSMFHDSGCYQLAKWLIDGPVVQRI